MLIVRYGDCDAVYCVKKAAMCGGMGVDVVVEVEVEVVVEVEVEVEEQLEDARFATMKILWD